MSSSLHMFLSRWFDTGFVLVDFCPALPSLCCHGKYRVSIVVPLFLSVTVLRGGCHSQGCHRDLTCLVRLMLSAPHPGHHSPSSSTVDEFNTGCMSPSS